MEKLSNPENGVSEDALFIWARGLAYPFLEPGETRDVDMLMSLMTSRLQHKPIAWEKAKLSREKSSSLIKVPAGTISVHLRKATLADGKTWTFYVEDIFPHRIIKWQTSDGEEGQLLKSVRLPYWKMNGEKFKTSIKNWS